MLDKYEKVIPALVLKIKEGGNEGKNAETTLRKLCVKYKLEYDDVVNGGEKKEDRYYRVTAFSKPIVVQIILRYGNSCEIYRSKSKKYLIAEVSLTDHIEVENAISILVPLYRKELKKARELVLEAFCYKHDLYWKGPQPERIGEQSLTDKLEQMKRAVQIQNVAEGMEDAVISKRLS